MTQVDAVPASRDVYSTETIPYTFDFTPLVATGDAISSPVLKITDDGGSSLVNGLVGNPTILGNTVIQAFGNFASRKKYTILCTATLNTNKIMTIRATLNCVG